MAERKDVAQAILDEMHSLTVAGKRDERTEVPSRTLVLLAEAWAWLEAPAQAHGGVPPLSRG